MLIFCRKRERHRCETLRIVSTSNMGEGDNVGDTGLPPTLPVLLVSSVAWLSTILALKRPASLSEISLVSEILPPEAMGSWCLSLSVTRLLRSLWSRVCGAAARNFSRSVPIAPALILRHLGIPLRPEKCEIHDPQLQSPLVKDD